jgi:hypothetical protein
MDFEIFYEQMADNGGMELPYYLTRKPNLIIDDEIYSKFYISQQLV